jgi:protein-tyrosine phosphatase
MKIAAYVLGLVALVIAAGYYYVSQPIPTIASVVNPDGVHNLHLIDENPETGFAIYRLGQPDADDVRGMCALGIDEIVVLAGSALEHEEAYKSECPSLKVIYNVEDTLDPLSGQWLDYFDNWVTQAQATGKKIAFRCSCGCHRTGRLAAYYQMKYRGFTPKEAWDLALARGRIMEAVDYFGGLQQQIVALHEYINDQSCSQGEYCVAQSSPQAACDDPLLGCGWSSSVL